MSEDPRRTAVRLLVAALALVPFAIGFGARRAVVGAWLATTFVVANVRLGWRVGGPQPPQPASMEPEAPSVLADGVPPLVALG